MKAVSSKSPTPLSLRQVPVSIADASGFEGVAGRAGRLGAKLFPIYTHTNLHHGEHRRVPISPWIATLQTTGEDHSNVCELSVWTLGVEKDETSKFKAILC